MATSKVEFTATLAQVNAAKTLKVVLEPFGSKGVSAIQSLVPMAETQVRVTIESMQEELPLDDEPSVCEGQVTIDEAGVIMEVAFVTPAPFAPNDGTLAVERLSMEEITERFPEPVFEHTSVTSSIEVDPNELTAAIAESLAANEAEDEAILAEPVFAAVDEVPFETADEDTGDDAPSSAPDDEPEAEPTLGDIEDAMFNEASEIASESGTLPSMPEPLAREKVMEAYQYLAKHGTEGHYKVKQDGVHYTFQKVNDSVKLTIGDSPDDDFAITAALSSFAPIPATSVSISKNRRVFTVSFPLWEQKGNVAEPEPVL